MFLSITAIGDAPATDVVYRHTSGENDLVCVTGDLGGAYMGLLLLEREKATYLGNPEMQPDLEGHDYVLSRQLKPEPRTDIIRLFREMGVKPTSMIDISDGLGSEILHLCKGSGLGCRLYEEKIPIDPTTVNSAAEFGISPITAALNGGEDYELLFTIAQADFEKVRLIPNISVIGHMTAPGDGAFLVTGDEQLIEIRAQGWNALKGKV
jgi:thiamine-monophosphate kinase